MMLSSRIIIVGLWTLSLLGCHSKKPACFECGITEEWARAERENEEHEEEEAPTRAPEQIQSGPCDDAELARVCEALGPQYRWRKPDMSSCSGDAPTEDEEEQLREDREAALCKCVDAEALQRRQDECSTIPSSAPDPGDES